MIVFMLSLLLVSFAAPAAADDASYNELKFAVSTLGGTALESVREECVGRSPLAERPSLGAAATQLERMGADRELAREAQALADRIIESIERRQAAITSCQGSFDRLRRARTYGDAGAGEAETWTRSCYEKLDQEWLSIGEQTLVCLATRSEVLRRLAKLDSPIPLGFGARERLNLQDVGSKIASCDEEEEELRCTLSPDAFKQERGWLGPAQLSGWATFVEHEGTLRLGSVFVFHTAESCSEAAKVVAGWWERLQPLIGPSPSTARRSGDDHLCALIPSSLRIGPHRFEMGTNRVELRETRYVSYVEVTSDTWARQAIKPKFERYD